MKKEEGQYKNNYRKYLSGATLDNAANKIMNSSFIVGYAIYLGIADKVIGFYVALNSIMCLIQILAGPIYSKIGQSKKVTLTIYSLYRISGILPIFIPLITSDITIRSTLFLGCMFCYSLFGELGYTPLVNWRMSLLKKEDRAKFFATKNFITNTLVMAMSFGAGILLDHYKTTGSEFSGFCVLFSIVVVVNLLDIYMRGSTYKPPQKEIKVNLKETIEVPLKDNYFIKLLVLIGIYTLALNIGQQYLSLFQLKYLHLNYTFISILNIVFAISNAFFGIFWMKLYEKRRWGILSFVFILYIIVFIGLSMVSSYSTFLLLIIYILFGIADSGYGLFDHNAIYESAKEGYKTVYLSVTKTIIGIVSILVPIITSFILGKDNNEESIKILFILAAVIFGFAFLQYRFNIAKREEI